MAYTVGEAYLQILPSTRDFGANLTEAVTGDSEKAGSSAGSSFSSGFGSVIGTVGKVAAGAIAASGAAVGSLVKEAVSSYGDYEQLVGGVETLFGTASSTVIRHANEAFETAGMSANDYMETVTSFSASLLQSLDGDTKTAAAAADLAIQDMADNSNKMGSDISNIQTAYQGFAKQNYTMLDNLKLGYGGTKSEMERLLADASELSGVDYNIDSLADVYSAIHVVQTEMGITGTTAAEASTTIQGSLSSMQAAWSNVVTAMGTEGGDLSGSIETLIGTAETFAGNLMPVIGTALTGVSELIAQLAPVIATELPGLISQSLPGLLTSGVQVISALANGILAALPSLLPTITDVILQIGTMLIQMAPQLLTSGLEIIVQLANGLTQALPTLIPTITSVILQIVDTLVSNIDLLIDAALQLMIALATGIVNALPQIVEKAPVIIQKLVEAIVRNLPKILEAGLKIIEMLVKGISSALGRLAEIGSQMFEKIKTAVSDKIHEITEVGKNIVAGIWEGINDKVEWLKDKISGFVGDVTSWLKKFFGIGSPSKVMADEVGKWLPLGLAQGIESNLGAVTGAVGDMADAALVDGSSLYNANALNMSHTITGETTTDASLYGLLATYLPQIAQGGNVTITLEGGADRIFTAMREQNYKFKKLTGNSAFA